MRRKLTPQTARTLNEHCSLERDNGGWGQWWWLVDGSEITLTKQKMGEPRTEQITLPKHVFDKFIRQYLGR